MDLEKARQSLSKPGGHSTKRLAFLGVAALCVAAGLVWRSGLLSGTPEAAPEASVAVEAPAPAETPAPAVEATEAIPKTAPVQPQPPAPETAAAPPTPPAPAAQPSAPVEQAAPAEPTQPADAVEQASEEPDLPGQGMILVSRQPVAMLASPSADASAMYGFPAGRPFRVIGREGNYAKIVDLKSGASGWIEAAALAPPPRAPTAAAPSKPQPASRTTGGAPSDPKPKPAAKKGSSQAAADPAPAEPSQPQTRDRPGVLFGPGGIFGGILGGN